MAGEWIKVRTNLWNDPRVSQLCDTTGSAEAMIVGGLYWLWATADEHTETGLMPGLSVNAIDRKTGIKGFGVALVAIGWISEADDGIVISRFDEHNGASAKSRAQTAKRQANLRSNAPSVTEALRKRDENVTSASPREEKRREEKKDTTTKENTAPPVGDAELFPGVDAQVIADFKTLRKQKKAAITKTGMEKIGVEASKAGLTLEAALRLCCSRGWQGFNAEWVLNKQGSAATTKQPTRHSGFEHIDYSEGIEDGRIT